MKAMPAGISGRYGGDQYILFYEYDEQVDIERLNRISKMILDKAPIPHQIVKMGVYLLRPGLPFNKQYKGKVWKRSGLL